MVPGLTVGCTPATRPGAGTYRVMLGDTSSPGQDCENKGDAGSAWRPEQEAEAYFQEESNHGTTSSTVAARSEASRSR